jgi:hypothetical protein
MTTASWKDPVSAAARCWPIPSITRPDAAWVTQQARNASMKKAEWNLPATHLLIDHDTKFVPGFDAVFAADGTEVKWVGPRA